MAKALWKATSGVPSPSRSAIAWFTMLGMSSTITCRSHEGFSYHATSGTASEFGITSTSPSPLKSATATA